jgi:hypothetical protein
MRYVVLAVLVSVVAIVHIRQRPASLCLLRTLTGVPCPFCGGTTAAVRLGAGDVRGSLAASPIALPLLLAWPWLGLAGPPRWAASRRVRLTAVAVVLAAAELWQLARFGFLGGFS